MPTSEPLNMLAMSQLGEPDPSAISKHDLLSSVAFDRTGKLLSVGDRGGRVITFQQAENENGQMEFEYMTEFQAHTKAFDVLSSQETNETVVSLDWVNSVHSSQPALLTANQRQVKLFRIHNKRVRKSESIKKKISKGGNLCMPKTKVVSES